MKNIKTKYIAFILAAAFSISLPLSFNGLGVKAATIDELECSIDIAKTDCVIQNYDAEYDEAKITLSGGGVKGKTIKVIIRDEETGKTVFKSKSLKVKNGKWKTNISKWLSEDSYEILIGSKTGTLTIGEEEGTNGNTSAQQTIQAPAPVQNKTTFSVATVPLLTGGIARGGMSVPVSYIQIKNIGPEPATLKGFWIRQNGSAPQQSVIGLSTVDDKGGSRGYTGGVEGATPFKDNMAFAPTDAVFAPGQMKLFTIKAQLGANINSYLGSQLMIDVVSLDANANMSGQFPIRGTTWTLWY
jgi:hypothetical protein